MVLRLRQSQKSAEVSASRLCHHSRGHASDVLQIRASHHPHHRGATRHAGPCHRRPHRGILRGERHRTQHPRGDSACLTRPHLAPAALAAACALPSALALGLVLYAGCLWMTTP